MAYDHCMDSGGKYLICVDSYEGGVMKGRIWNPSRRAEVFSSLSQFLLIMEGLLNEQQEPQAYTVPRTFFQSSPWEPELSEEDSRRGDHSTFELKVIFRRNSSWQGILLWLETQQKEHFRSVLEMVILMDSALRRQQLSCCQ